MRAAEHSPCSPRRLLVRRHGLAKITEHRAVGFVERRRVNRSRPRPRRPPCIFCLHYTVLRCRRGVFSCRSACGRGASGHAGKWHYSILCLLVMGRSVTLEEPQLASFSSPAGAESWNHTSPSLYTSESRPVRPVPKFSSQERAARGAPVGQFFQSRSRGKRGFVAILSSQAKCSPVGQFRSFPVGLPLLPSSQLSSCPVFQSELGRSYRRHIRE